MLHQEVKQLSLQFHHYRYMTTTLEEKGRGLLRNALNIDDLDLSSGTEPKPRHSTYLLPLDSSGEMCTEDGEVNSPIHHVLQELVPKPYVSKLTCQSSPLIHNVREHRVDNVISEGKMLTWSSCIMFGEGKLSLSGNQLHSAIGQCSQRTFAFMEETKHDHKSMKKPRDVVWAFFYDKTDIGFYCRRRNETVLFPFNLPENFNTKSHEVVFEKKPFLRNGVLESGGRCLWHLLRTKSMLGYHGKDISQPVFSVNGKHQSWRTIQVLSQRIKYDALSSVVIAVNQSVDLDDYSASSDPTHVVKLSLAHTDEVEIYKKSVESPM